MFADPRIEGRCLRQQVLQRFMLSIVIVPIDIERGLEAVVRQHSELRLLDHLLFVDVEDHADRMNHPGHRSPDQIPRVLDTTRPWQRR